MFEDAILDVPVYDKIVIENKEKRNYENQSNFVSGELKEGGGGSGGSFSPKSRLFLCKRPIYIVVCICDK